MIFFMGVEFTKRLLSGVVVTVSSGGRGSPFPSIRLDGVRENGGEYVEGGVEKVLAEMGSTNGDTEREMLMANDLLRKGKYKRVNETKRGEGSVEYCDGKKGKGRRIVFSKDAVRSNWRYYLCT